ncbi:MAG TPA: phosphatidate cytidylyltransferase [Limnochordales bacterium]
MLGLRAATVAVGAPLMLGALYLGGLPWGLALTALTVWGALELGDLFVAKGMGHPQRDVLAVAGVAGLWLAPAVQVVEGSRWQGVVALMVPAVAFSYAALRAWGRGASVLQEASAASFAFFYVGVFGGFWWLLRQSHPLGWPYGLMALVGTWATDMGAYLVGRALGRRRLVPRISPSKTVEGAVGGLFCGVGSVVLLGRVGFGMSWWVLAALGLVTAVAAQLGDLAESALKRDANVKDSGWLLPGHGGILDRMDSVLVAGPAAYLFLACVAGF